jgi:hypothetical protein
MVYFGKRILRLLPGSRYETFVHMLKTLSTICLLLCGVEGTVTGTCLYSCLSNHECQQSRDHGVEQCL